MLLLLDNYDSFTYNLVHLFYALGAEIAVHRNREISAESALSLNPSGIVLSPGPGRPGDAGIMPALLEQAAAKKIPVLGVCLGHQCIGEVFGGKIVGAREIMHGKISEITHDGKGIFAGLASPLSAVRYHSLAVEESTLPAELEISARAPDGEIMGLRHRTLPIEGIQYHPESVMSTTGKRQLANFLKLCSPLS